MVVLMLIPATRELGLMTILVPVAVQQQQLQLRLPPVIPVLQDVVHAGL